MTTNRNLVISTVYSVIHNEENNLTENNISPNTAQSKDENIKSYDLTSTL